MIPYIEQPSIRIGPLTIHAFGAIVAAAVVAGLAIGARRFTQLGLDRAFGERMAWWAVVGGLLGAHVFSVILYFPRELAANPLLLLKVWQDISSFGGILGGTLGIWLFLRLRAPLMATPTRWAYLDVAAFVFPISLMIGRIACSLAHDHPGTLTTFPLAISLRSSQAQAYVVDIYQGAGRLAEVPNAAMLAHLGFHDLGWYEFLYLASVVVPITLASSRRQRTPGFFLVMFVALYMPVRFLLDFLRVSDVRYGRLTPGQWIAIAMLMALPALVSRVRAIAHTPSPPALAMTDGSTRSA